MFLGSAWLAFCRRNQHCRTCFSCLCNSYYLFHHRLCHHRLCHHRLCCRRHHRHHHCHHRHICRMFLGSAWLAFCRRNQHCRTCFSCFFFFFFFFFFLFPPFFLWFDTTA